MTLSLPSESIDAIPPPVSLCLANLSEIAIISEDEVKLGEWAGGDGCLFGKIDDLIEITQADGFIAFIVLGLPPAGTQ